jgi:hypothetical protein
MLSNNSSVSPLVVNFNSIRRSNGTNSNFFSLPIDFKINKYDSVCLLQAQIPKSAYNIDDPYNTFILEENGSTVQIIVPPASYNNINILPVLTYLLNTNSPLGFTYEVFYNNSTWKCGDPDIFKFQFKVSGNGIIQPIFTFPSIFSIHNQLGFDIDIPYNFIGNELLSANCINMSNITRCFIKSNVVFNAYLSILEEVLNYGDYGPLQVCYYQQQSIDLNSREFNNTGLNSWQFSVVDRNDSLLNLNNIPWSISLVFFQRNDIHELQSLELKIQNELRILDLQKKQEDIIRQVDSKGKLIEVQQDKIIADNQLTALNPNEVPSLDPIQQALNNNIAIFQVQPWGSSGVVKDVTVDSDEFPKEIKI